MLVVARMLNMELQATELMTSGKWAIHLSQMQPCQYVLMLKIDDDLDSVNILLHSQHSQPQHHLLVVHKPPTLTSNNPISMFN